MLFNAGIKKGQLLKKNRPFQIGSEEN